MEFISMGKSFPDFVGTMYRTLTGPLFFVNSVNYSCLLFLNSE